MPTPKVDRFTNPEICEIIDLYVHNEMHRKILKRKLCDGLTYEKIAEELDFSVCSVKKVVYCYSHLFEY